MANEKDRVPKEGDRVRTPNLKDGLVVVDDASRRGSADGLSFRVGDWISRTLSLDNYSKAGGRRVKKVG